ncbi:DUF1127 domain-containing protein [Vibrio sp. ZSDZ65]|uniref:DUF1127 domain-containing protein n=1 Tax=Vibrio qingdaonensis TaxID=2829491 RepID=A0A9X3HVH4_9VIBR|nr:DUF1127 domain-containing protein [Vibrio qingdaonensis]MCW8345306.1 DUF1127 domain-containing protein [Vibrio qingdaonensis]
MKNLNALEGIQIDDGMHSQLAMLSKKFLLILTVWHRNYVTRRSLHGMSDHMLRDIGLTQNEAEVESRRLFWQ